MNLVNSEQKDKQKSFNNNESLIKAYKNSKYLYKTLLRYIIIYFIIYKIILLFFLDAFAILEASAIQNTPSVLFSLGKVPKWLQSVEFALQRPFLYRSKKLNALAKRLFLFQSTFSVPNLNKTSDNLAIRSQFHFLTLDNDGISKRLFSFTSKSTNLQ